MTEMFDLSATGKGRVLAVSSVVTLGCIAISFGLTTLGLDPFGEAQWPMRVFINLVVPTVIAFPTIYVLMSKIRELAIAHQQLQVIASMDGLTAVLNRGAFTMLVEAYLEQTRSRDAQIRGALLIVDADHFKEINDRFGHAQGDIALRTIAQGIKGVLRGADIVGRIGGEEFGVFLPGSDIQQAGTVAERIRTAIDVAEFRPDGERRALSVSVGGATFERRIDFTELFRIADRRLYEAKHGGRNRVSVAPVNFAFAA